MIQRGAENHHSPLNLIKISIYKVFHHLFEKGPNAYLLSSYAPSVANHAQLRCN